MPTDLPPDYKPQPAPHPTLGVPPVHPPAGEDSRDPMGTPRPAPGTPGPEGDVVDPPGWGGSLGPGSVPAGVPSPAGTPTF